MAGSVDERGAGRTPSASAPGDATAAPASPARRLRHDRRHRGRAAAPRRRPDPPAIRADPPGVGEVITAVDGQPITLAEQLGPIVRTRPPGQPVMFTVDRAGKSIPVTVVSRAAAQGACQGRAQVGISTSTRSEKFDFPVNVEVDTGRVSGPSAGLALTLTILDGLTHGDLTGGKKVAVTGTIQADG